MDKLEQLEITAKENNVPIMMKDGIEFLTDLVKERKPKEEKPKEEKWKFLKVLWGKAQSIGEELNKYVDGITDSDDEDNNE